MKKENVINVYDVIVKFDTIPNPKKLNRQLRNIKAGMRPVITVTSKFILVDGYSAYLAYRELGYEEVPYVVNDGAYNRHTLLKYAYKESNGYCYICNRKCITPEETNGEEHPEGLNPTLDHKIPRWKGGPYSKENMVLCCRLCNILKGQLSYSEELKTIIIRELEDRGLLNKEVD